MSLKKTIDTVVLVFFLTACVSSTFAGTGGVGKSHTVTVTQNLSIVLDNAFNNISTSTSESQYSISVYDTLHTDSGYTGSWSYNLSQSVYQQNVKNAIQHYEQAYAATGNIPMAAEFQTYLQGLSEQYSGSTPSGGLDPQANWDAMYNWVYNQWTSDWGRGSIQSEPPLSSSSNTAGTGSGPFSSTYSFQTTGNGQVNLIGSNGKNISGANVSTQINKTLAGNVGATASGNTYSESFTFSSSPLVLDIAGNGKIEASNGNWLPHPGKFYSQRLARFDLLGDGFPLIMEWVGPDDGLLVDVSMGDCSSTHVDGTCLFGNPGGFASGYEKLEILDKNHDGQLNGSELDNLYVWQDKNGNGKVDPAEMQSVQSLGITAIGIAHNADMTGSFVRNGKTFTMWDWYPNAMEVLKHRQ